LKTIKHVVYFSLFESHKHFMTKDVAFTRELIILEMSGG